MLPPFPLLPRFSNSLPSPDSRLCVEGSEGLGVGGGGGRGGGLEGEAEGRGRRQWRHVEPSCS